MKIRPVGTELFHADGRTDMTKLMDAFPILQTRPKIFVGYYYINNNSRVFYMHVIDNCPVISSASIGAVKLV
jgi:hypothetical protein